MATSNATFFAATAASVLALATDKSVRKVDKEAYYAKFTQATFFAATAASVFAFVTASSVVEGGRRRVTAWSEMFIHVPCCVNHW